jgi:hypothetical protein
MYTGQQVRDALANALNGFHGAYVYLFILEFKTRFSL